MIRTLRLGCAPGGSCCSECAGHHLGDTPDAPDTSSNGAWWVALMIFGGFGLAYAASGKAGRQR
jgi:hypothetical protein